MSKTKRVKLSEFKNNPSSDVLIPKEYVAEVKVEDEDNRILEFTISTNAVDRDGDTIDAAGWKLDNYHKNPVVLWGHDHYTPAIGQSLASWIEGDALKSRNQYPTREEYEFGNLIFRLHAGGYLRSVSVGFIPIKYVINEERGSRGWGPPIDFLEQELLEHSSCNVPANPEALQSAAAKGLDMRSMLKWYEGALDRRDELIVDPKSYEAGWKILKDICGNGAVIQLPLLAKTVGKIVESALERGLPEVTDAPTEDKAASKEQREALAAAAKNKRVISYASAHADGTPKAPRDEEWDGPGEVAAAEVDDLKVMCSWVDEENDENKGAYKIPHHKAAGQHSVVWRGVTAAAARLPQTDIPEGDVSGVQAHLGKHYVEFDEVAPWDREEDTWTGYVERCKDLSEDEAEAEFQKLFCSASEEPTDPGVDPPAADSPADPPADPEVEIETPPEPEPQADPEAPADPPADAGDADPDVEAEFEAVTERLEGLARQVSKAGRVLSSANENRLRRSRDLLDEVLAQLEEQDDDDKTVELTDDEGNVLLTVDEGQLEEITNAAKEVAASELRRASGALD